MSQQSGEHLVSVSNPLFKAGSLWAAVGIGSWADIASAAQTFAAIAALIYSALLIGEWFWRKFWRPLFERHGWIQPLPRRRRDDPGERWERRR